MWLRPQGLCPLLDLLVLLSMEESRCICPLPKRVTRIGDFDVLFESLELKREPKILEPAVVLLEGLPLYLLLLLLPPEEWAEEWEEEALRDGIIVVLVL